MSLELISTWGAMAILLVLFLVRGKKSGTVKIGGKEVVSISDGDEKIDSRTPHQKCPYSKDVPTTMRAQRVLVEKIACLRQHELLADQMILIENTIDIIMSDMRQRFMKLLRDVAGGKNGLIASPAWDSYHKCLQIVKWETKSLMKRYLKENHLAKKEGAEFETYISQRSTALISFVTELLNREYKEEKPSREQVYDANQEILPDVKTQIGSALRQCREIAIENKEEIAIYERQIKLSFDPFILGQERDIAE